MNIEKFKKGNNLFSLEELSKELKLDEDKIKEIIKIYNLEFVEFENINFYTETTKSEIIKLSNIKLRCLDDNLKTLYINCGDVVDYFGIRTTSNPANKLRTLTSYYDLTAPIFYKCRTYITIDDFNFLKKLPHELISKNYTTCVVSKELKNELTLENLAKEFNISLINLKTWVDTKQIILSYKKIKRVRVCDDDARRILKKFLDDKKKYIYTIVSMAKELNVTEEKIVRYLRYLKPKEDEYNGKFYTQEFFDKLKKLMMDYPTLRQNKVYVDDYKGICFDSTCEAIFYVYLIEHGYDVKYHPIKFDYIDIDNKPRTYEVDFLVNGKLIEIKGKNQFDKNGNPYGYGRDWSKKLECMKEHDVFMINSIQFETRGCLKFMVNYFHKNHKFVKHMIKKIKEEVECVSEEDKKYWDSLKRAIRKHDGIAIKCIETSEIHLRFEWKKILNIKNVDVNFGIHGLHYKISTYEEYRSYILSKIEELRSKGLDVSWFEIHKDKYLPEIPSEIRIKRLSPKDKEKYLKTENEEETIFDL